MRRDNRASQARTFSRRALILGGAQLGAFGLIGWRLHQLQIVEAEKYGLLAEENRISLQLVPAERGIIVDRFGEAIATNVDSLQVAIVPAHTDNIGLTLSRLSSLIPVTPADVDRVTRLAKRQSPHLPIKVVGHLTWQQFAQVNALSPDLPGVQTDILPERQYRHASSMAHIVGYVGAANKQEAAKDDPVVRLPGVRIGKAGIERGFESKLRGRAGNVKLEVNAYGRPMRRLHTVDSEQGSELVLTVDHAIQNFCMKRIEEERRASVVVLDAQGGELLAMASTPTFDPNTIVSGIGKSAWADLSRAKDDPLNSRALRGQYPPGSTFKMITVLAGLESGDITPEEVIHCPGAYRYSGHTYRCWRSHGPVRAFEAIRSSCDVYCYETARRVGVRAISEMGRKFGLGQTYDIGLPLQKAGVMPTPEWKRKALDKPWYGGETIVAAIGQGYVLTTPLQLAVMAARLATGREIMPRVVRPDPDETIEQAPLIDIDEDNLALMQRAMTAVVNEPGGTARGSRLPTPDILMAGKTGTSQVTKRSIGRHYTSLKWEDRDHALFVAYAPADAPRYAMAVIVEHGGGGSRAAAPIARDVMVELLKRDPIAKATHVPADKRRKTAGERRRRSEG